MLGCICILPQHGPGRREIGGTGGECLQLLVGVGLGGNMNKGKRGEAVGEGGRGSEEAEGEGDGWKAECAA